MQSQPVLSANDLDRTGGRLDHAVLAYRANPTPANRVTLLAAQQQHVDHFHAEMTSAHIARTR